MNFLKTYEASSKYPSYIVVYDSGVPVNNTVTIFNNPGDIVEFFMKEFQIDDYNFESSENLADSVGLDNENWLIFKPSEGNWVQCILESSTSWNGFMEWVNGEFQLYPKLKKEWNDKIDLDQLGLL